MSDPGPSLNLSGAPPPPAPPLPQALGRLAPLQRIFHIGPKASGIGGQDEDDERVRGWRESHRSTRVSRTATHHTDIAIAAIDINKHKTHAILAGKEILKTVRVDEGKITDEFDIRSSVTSYASTHTPSRPDIAEKRREYLPARDVRWSIGHWDHVVATAANNGRITLYDLQAPSARTELAWLHEHTGQINKLDFDHHAGYLLLSASQDKTVRLWDLREPKLAKSRTVFDVRSGARDVRWSPNPDEPFDFAVCADSGVIQKWDIRAPMLPKLAINAHEKPCYSIDYHPDGRHVVSGGADKYIRVWDFETERKRQKPTFQLKAPHAIRNIRWRPPCDGYGSRDLDPLQSTQIAASYYHDDPRIHIWDLRRPLLPFRDLDKYNIASNDLLWADKDLLWTVGDQGTFTQWDVRHIAPFYNQVSPSTSTFMPDGEFFSFAENREMQFEPIRDDPALGFLSVPRDEPSGGDDIAAMSRSLTDDEAVFDNANPHDLRRREHVLASSRSSKSLANSPPTWDGRPQIMALDEAMLQRQDLFENDQIGASCFVPGVAAEPHVVEHLASHYATPATTEDNKASPNTILQRLEQVFHQNASACDAVSMHRMAQSWRILGAVIVPELKDWADQNRANRRVVAAKRKNELKGFRSGSHRSILSPLAGRPANGTDQKHESKTDKRTSSLLHGMAGVDRTRDMPVLDSTSNVTTPLAKPLLRSHPNSEKGLAQKDAEDGLDNLPALPPSVLTSHSTAAAAARALLSSPRQVTKSDSSSPEIFKMSNASTGIPDSMVSSDSSVKRPKSDLLAEQQQLPSQRKTEEERRTALRDYRVQARPIFSLSDTVQGNHTEKRTDSAESFPMFSVSTDSSHKLQSALESLDSSDAVDRPVSYRMASDLSSDRSEDSSISYLNEANNPTTQDVRYKSVSAIDEPSETDYRDFSARPDLAKGSHAGYEPLPSGALATRDAVSTSPELFPMDGIPPVPKPRIHTSNPVRTQTTKKQEVRQIVDGSVADIDLLSLEELDTETYLWQDFRPINLSRYEPKLPFAWSSLPLICQCIAFDLDNGVGHAQFAAHLLMHVCRYFFHPSFCNSRRTTMRPAESVVDRLMLPYLSHRVIEAVFQTHLLHLKQLRLFEPAAFMRKMMVQFDYPNLNSSKSEDKKLSDAVDASTLSMSCSNCLNPVLSSQSSCDQCHQTRAVCPVCESLHGVDEASISKDVTALALRNRSSNMWMSCQACGHSGHIQCFTEWFDQDFSEGTCPTPGCGCDCAPGPTRDARLRQQMQSEDDTKLIRGATTSQVVAAPSRRDPFTATPSPAVDKTRAALRKSFANERATQSGDERSLPGKKSGSRTRSSALNASRKSVRLVTPGEESSQSQSRS